MTGEVGCYALTGSGKATVQPSPAMNARRLMDHLTLWLRKGFGFAGPWTVREQNRLLALCFGLPQVSKT